MKTKIIFISMLAVIAVGLSSCSDDDNENPTVSPTDTGTMTDKEGNTYKWVRLGTLDWMAQNLKSGTPFYEQKSENMWGDITPTFSLGFIDDEKTLFNTFGNYYTYSEALANCPDGWRLPTDDDWKALEREFGMSGNEIDQLGWRNGAGNLMIQTGDEGSGLNLRYGGQMCSVSTKAYEHSHTYDYGYYWSATIDTTSAEQAAIARVITPYQNKVERASVLTEGHWMNVRYVRDAKTNAQ